ncbi:hypothetical protein HOY82DRAFT_672106 [Tuber indicum]|nr:hypothetical protein HOY82DRAFT_672106 [Tuber indicum]
MCAPLMRDVDSGDDSEEPLDSSESTQILATAFPESTAIKDTAAGDSISIAITDTGKVNWFNERTRIQSIPILLSTLKNIVLVGIGTDRILGFATGEVFTCGQLSAISREPASMGSPLASSAFLGLRSNLETLPAEDIVSDASSKPRYLSATHVVFSIKLPSIGYGRCNNITISWDGRARS